MRLGSFRVVDGNRTPILAVIDVHRGTTRLLIDRQGRFLHVGFIIEIEEHREHEEVLNEARECNQLRMMAGIMYQHLQEMQGQVTELDQLQLGDVSLPPDDAFTGPQ